MQFKLQTFALSHALSYFYEVFFLLLFSLRFISNDSNFLYLRSILYCCCRTRFCNIYLLVLCILCVYLNRSIFYHVLLFVFLSLSLYRFLCAADGFVYFAGICDFGFITNKCKRIIIIIINVFGTHTHLHMIIVPNNFTNNHEKLLIDVIK